MTRGLAQYLGLDSFQSIGVTKDWRPVSSTRLQAAAAAFPINRRHQGLATNNRFIANPAGNLFPINRRHQGLATTRAAFDANDG